jgi:hypothetical protein
LGLDVAVPHQAIEVFQVQWRLPGPFSFQHGDLARILQLCEAAEEKRDAANTTPGQGGPGSQVWWLRGPAANNIESWSRAEFRYFQREIAHA